jgi:N-acetylglucosaminyldiphosphoundecaprenol N-acetyl-beta-D-mannosaminyltransferase
MNKYQPFVNIMGYQLFTGSLEQISITKKMVINTLNQYCYCMAEIDADYKKALEESDILLPDGISIVAAVKVLKGEKINKIAGADLHHYLLEQLQKSGGSCFYLGSSSNTLREIKEKVTKEYPAIRVGFFSPPYKPVFTQEDNAQMIETVNTFAPDILFVGMTAPKQEKWAHAHKEQVNAKLVCSIGVVFDFYAGTITRPHPFWINIGMEWFVRLIKEPKRMWKRYLYYGPIFIYDLLKNKLKQPL